MFLLDDGIRDLLESILNVKLDSLAWTQAFLPVRWGGVGVRSPLVLAICSFLASCHASAPVVAELLPTHLRTIPDAFVNQAQIIWQGLAHVTLSPSGPTLVGRG